MFSISSYSDERLGMFGWPQICFLALWGCWLLLCGTLCLLINFFFFYHLLGLSPTSKLLHISWAGSLRKSVTVYTIQIPREWTKKAENFQFQRGVSYTPFGGLLGWMKTFETESLVLWFFYISSFSCYLYELLCWLPRWNSNPRKGSVSLGSRGRSSLRQEAAAHTVATVRKQRAAHPAPQLTFPLQCCPGPQHKGWHFLCLGLVFLPQLT